MTNRLSFHKNQLSKIWVTSDSHYSHKGICRGVSKWPKMGLGNYTRDFDTLEEMNDVIVSGINKCVDTNDILFHLGDWSFGNNETVKEFRNRVHCKNIHLILGNHDLRIRKNPELQKLFLSVSDYLEFSVIEDRTVFCLFHYPIEEWNSCHRGSVHLHGHVHTNKTEDIANRINVCCDANDPLYSPLNIDSVYNGREIEHKKFKSHHNTCQKS